MGMGESRWATEDASPNSGKARRGGRKSRNDRGGSRSGGHSPASSQHGSTVGLPQSHEEKFIRNQGRAQESSNWGDDPVGAGATNGGGWGSNLIPNLPPGDEACTWGSDCIIEETKQLKDGRGTDSVPTGKTQPQVDGNDWDADTVPAENNRELGTPKERSHDWGARTGHDDYSHSRPVRDSRGAHGGNSQYGRVNRDVDESSNGDKSRNGGGGHLGRGSWNGVAQSAYNRSTYAKVAIEPAWSGQGNTAPSWGDDSHFAPQKGQDFNNSDAGYPDALKWSQDAETPPPPAQEPTSTWDDQPGWRPSRFKKHEPKW